MGINSLLTVTPFCSIRGFFADCFFISLRSHTNLLMMVLRCYELSCPFAGGKYTAWVDCWRFIRFEPPYIFCFYILAIHLGLYLMYPVWWYRYSLLTFDLVVPFPL